MSPGLYATPSCLLCCVYIETLPDILSASRCGEDEMVTLKESLYGVIDPIKKICIQNAVGTFQYRKGCTHLMGRNKSLTEDAQDTSLGKASTAQYYTRSLELTSALDFSQPC